MNIKKTLFIIMLIIPLFLINKVNAYNVFKISNISNDNNLNSLSASGTDLAYNIDQDVYNVDFNLDSDTMRIYATLSSDKASFVDGYGPRTVYLNYGFNEIFVKVKAESGDIKTYTINVNKIDNRSNNNYLSNIVINGKALNFEKDKMSYSFSVPYSTKSLQIKAPAIDTKAKVTYLQNEKLVVGDNTISILVEAENGALREYYLKVFRSETNEIPPSSNTRLALLTIDGYDLSFNSDTYDYQLTVKDEQDLIIKAYAEDEKASIKIIDNDRITNNSIVEIRVIAEDGSLASYKINIIVDGVHNVNKYLIIIIFVSLVALISLTVIIVSNYKKKRHIKQVMNINSNVVKKKKENKDEELVSFLLGNKNDPNKIKCLRCGVINNKESIYCKSCGEKLNKN